mmetsp:Transcript_29505/g.29124  ORF Transcript_29505/g.29124 Transcript_29505/m.29124 type:complete len:96 (+) Transcript_29505:15-302(+)
MALSRDQIYKTKIFLRSHSDALDCVEEIAERDQARSHYRAYMGDLINGMKEDQILIDSEGKIIASKSQSLAEKYQIMTFSKSIFEEYGLDRVSNK